MRIVLCCAGGFSTTMLMKNMENTVKDSQKLDVKDFEFVAIPVDLLKMELDNCDVLVVGPQIAHRLDYITPLLKPNEIPYVVIDQDTYGKMDGATALKMALIAHKKAELAKQN
ncbi:MAG: PTS sugar transporter subunit IIB [Clostridium sp.]